MQFSSRFVFFVCAVSAFAATPPDSALSRGKAALAQTPLRFEANQGQYGKEIRYAARAGGYRVYLTNSGASLAFGAQKVNVRMLHSSAAHVEALDPMAVRTNYLLGARANWHMGVANYAQVRYRGVYPGIDVLYYGDGNKLEYDFQLQPGADPAAIRMRFEGARHLRVTEAGEVEFDSDGGRMTQNLPAIYQRDAAGARQQVRGRYVLVARNTVGVKVDGYDRRRELTIDPTLVYSSYIGGSSSDQINDARIDQNGLLYLCGSTDTSDLQPAGNSWANNLQGITNIFVAVFDTNNNYNLVYLSYLGGSNLDIPLAMQVDKQGNIYLTGTTTSTNFPLAGNSVQTSGAATTVWAFVTELSPNNPDTPLPYSTFLGGTQGNTSGNGIDLDAAGNIYVVGTTKASDFPVTASAYAGVIYGPQDAFLVELNEASTTPLYATFLGGIGDDDGRGIAVTPAGLVYFGATTVSPDFPMAGASYRGALSGPEDMILGVMDMTKSGVDSLVYCTYFGGSDVDELRNLKLDASGNVIVSGYTLSGDYPVTGDAMQVSYGGNGDAVVSVVNPLSPKFLVYSTYLGGTDGEVAYDAVGDAAGNLYVTGYTMSTDFPVSADAYQPGFAMGIEIFVTEIRRGVPGRTAIQYSTYVGGASMYQGSAIAVGGDGRFYVTGWAGTGLPNIGNALQSGFGGGFDDGFLLVFQPNGVPPTSDAVRRTRRPIVRR